MKFVVRKASASDLPGITAIYAYFVRTGLASFEYERPETVTDVPEHGDSPPFSALE